MYDISKNSEAIIRVAKREFHGKEFIDIRQFYLDGDGDFKPTQKGVTLSPDKMPELIKALMEISKLSTDQV